MIALFALLLALHGVIHLLGFAKAFGLADLPQLMLPISRAMGVVWLLAAVSFVAAAVSLVVWPRGWWAVGAAAVVLSMVAIVPSWADARFGALADALALAAVVAGFLAIGPVSLRAAYESDVAAGLGRFRDAGVVTEGDLAPLPPRVQQYLGRVGVVGHARVRNVRARMHGRIRQGPEARWMPIQAEQYNFYDEPSRLFYLTARMFGVPVLGYHRYVGPSASMRIRAAGLVTVAEASGPVMTQGETVTLLNDMCFLAPATLIDPAIRWEPIDALHVRAIFTNAGHTVRAELEFDAAGDLVNFRSSDRAELAGDGKTLKAGRWSTPLGGPRMFEVGPAEAGPRTVRLASRGEARYERDGVEYAYIELEIDEVAYNLTRR